MGSVHRKLHDAQRDHFYREFPPPLTVIVKISPALIASEGIPRMPLIINLKQFGARGMVHVHICLALEVLRNRDKNKQAIISYQVGTVTHPAVGPANKNSPENLIVD